MRVATLFLLLGLALCVLAAQLSSAVSHTRRHTSKGLPHNQQELDRSAPNTNGTYQSQSLYNLYLQPRGVEHAPKPLVGNFDVHHVGRPGHSCHTSKGVPRLQVPVSPSLIAPVVVVAHNRPHYLSKCVLTLLRYWHEDSSNMSKFPIYISIDGEDEHTLLFASTLTHAANIQVIQNLKDHVLCGGHGRYCYLSQHYKMLLQLFFECHNAPRLLFLEEDLEVAPDFFSYFEATAPLLDRDASLLCVSAWNDHGQIGRASNVTALYRTDIMPGLGWMLTAAVGRELHAAWPRLYWDDWLREPLVRRGRQCVFPEVPRTHTYGKSGTSGGQYYTEHLHTMLLSREKVNWPSQDLSYLEQGRYLVLMKQWLAAAEPLVMGSTDLQSFCRLDLNKHSNRTHESVGNHDYVVHFSNLHEYVQLARALAPMVPDTKGNAGRASHNGTVMVRCRTNRLFLAPT